MFSSLFGLCNKKGVGGKDERRRVMSEMVGVFVVGVVVVFIVVFLLLVLFFVFLFSCCFSCCLLLFVVVLFSLLFFVLSVPSDYSFFLIIIFIIHFWGVVMFVEILLLPCLF